MKKNHPNPGQTFRSNSPVIVSDTDATGIAPNMPSNDGEGMWHDLGSEVPQAENVFLFANGDRLKG